MLKVVNHAYKLIPVKNWDIKNLVVMLGISLDYN